MTPANSADTGGGNRRVLLTIGGLVLLGIAITLLILIGGWFNGGENNNPLLESIPAFSGTPESAVAPLDPELADLPVAGSPAPDFTLNDLDGNTIRLSDYRDQPVILNFWATWCGPCRVEMPELEQVQQDYADAGLVVLLVNQQESPERVKAFAEELGLTAPIVLDSETQVGEAYGAFFLPSTVFVGLDGSVSAFHRGIITRGQIEAYLAEMGVEATG
jgi:peroxiredoxin